MDLWMLPRVLPRRAQTTASGVPAYSANRGRIRLAWSSAARRGEQGDVPRLCECPSYGRIAIPRLRTSRITSSPASRARRSSPRRHGSCKPITPLPRRHTHSRLRQKAVAPVPTGCSVLASPLRARPMGRPSAVPCARGP
jgi:hypothetical protein